MRKDADMSLEVLEKLWETDAKRSFYKWSYRIYETPSAINDPSPFVLYLFEKFRDTIDKNLRGCLDFQNLSNLTYAFDSGHVTLNRWTDSVRSVAGGEAWKETRLARKTDPEAIYHLKNVYKNIFGSGQKK